MFSKSKIDLSCDKMSSVKVCVCRSGRQQQTRIRFHMQLEESAQFLRLTIGRAWKLQSDFRLWIICLHLQKLELFCCSYCGKMGQKEGQDTAPAAVHTGHHGKAQVKFNNQAGEAIWSSEEIRSVAYFPAPRHWQQVTFMKNQIFSVLHSSLSPSLCIYTVLPIQWWQ